ncbi:C-type lectin domain family 10 member A isoform X3 [Megalobrama amblycephala]|uniref:C-type lectin domain family 10 member A isoform X3 n=1 Tax=Megalobrama amblycephala TaxID=75352 RepID=UPI002013C70E|nr:C-type lectin domain family 10 member A isoform X3 [Megalobrama amblycephala]
MMEYQKNGSTEEIMKMDMEYERKTTFTKGHLCSRKTAIFVLLGTVCIIILMIMTSVILFHQQRTFSELESLMNVHSSNQTSVKPDLQITEVQVKNIETLISNLASSLSSISSKQEENQQKMESLSSSVSEMKSSVSDLSSSVSSLSSQLSVIIQDDSQTEVKSLMNNLSSAVSALTAKLNDAVNKQDQKQTETERSLDILKSSIQTDQQNKQRDFVQQQDMKSLIDSLNSAVSNLTSKLNDAVNKQVQKQTETERSLDSLKSSIQTDQQNKQRDFESLSSSLSVLKSSVSDLTSSVASLSSKQQTSEERIMNALKDLRSNTSNKTADVPVTCKSGWISYKSSCFLFSSNKLNWTQARDYCKTQDALLLKIQDDDGEWAFLNHRTIPTSYWVGLTDQTTGQWRWADDTPYTMNTERWDPGQPDDWTNHGLGEEGEDCGQISYTGKLNDCHCSMKLKYICRVQILN